MFRRSYNGPVSFHLYWLSDFVAGIRQKCVQIQADRQSAKEASRLAHERRVRDGIDPDAVPWIETEWVDADGYHRI